jgi:hypothetical protein
MQDSLHQRLDRLKETRDYHFNKAYEEYIEFKNKNDQIPFCDKEEVVKEMKDNWRVRKQQEQNIIGKQIDLRYSN